MDKDNGYKPLVPSEKTMSEFTIRALLIGLVMCVVLGAANAYLGLKAGMTIAATYPAAVISMALLRLFRGSVLEENFARTVGSIGESIAAGAIFTVPAFVIVGLWTFDPSQDYLKASLLMVVGGVLGILFVTVLRRVMVHDKTLPFPESQAAASIHKAGQVGAGAAKTLFSAMGVGAFIYLLGQLKLFLISNDFVVKMGDVLQNFVRLGYKEDAYKLRVGGSTVFAAPAVSPAYIGVGYIIGPALAALNFSGGLLAWGVFVPLFVYFFGVENLQGFADVQNLSLESPEYWPTLAEAVWKYIVRPIAVGGMLVGACYTLFRMRQSLKEGLGRAVRDVKSATSVGKTTERVENDLDLRIVGLGILATFVLMVALYLYFTGTFPAALLAGIVMLLAGFFFAAVSGNLVGMIGSSSNPVSGLTLASLVIAALMMLIIGISGDPGVAAVLGVASVVCVSSAVAGEMLQDLKVGHILGGTPWKMQLGDIIGVVAASFVMFFPLWVLHSAYGFGSKDLPTPQAGLMASLAKGIIGGEMAWPLVIIGILMGIGFICLRVRSPMLVAVGMYLPFETTFAIFIGGMVKALQDMIVKRRGYNEAQARRVENAGILCASGLIAGEALTGLVVAGVKFVRGEFYSLPTGMQLGLAGSAIFMLAIIGYLVLRPLKDAGRPEDEAPPSVPV